MLSRYFLVGLEYTQSVKTIAFILKLLNFTFAKYKLYNNKQP